jgi:hypothetical protein
MLSSLSAAAYCSYGALTSSRSNTRSRFTATCTDQDQ